MATHNEVAHAWAHQTGKARKGFNMFYDGATIYSYGYHFPIARIVKGEGDKGDCVLFTTDSRSVSTAKHKTYTRRAIGHLRVFTVPDVMANGSWSHGQNYEYYIATIKDTLDKAKRARKYGDMHMRDAEGLIVEANDYSEQFGLDKPVLTLATFGEAYEQLQAQLQARREAAAIEERKRQRAAFVALKDKVKAWFKGETSYCPHTPFPVVRVAGDKLETSWGASVPLEQALAVYRVAKGMRRAGKPMSLPGSVGDYGKAHIDRRGNIKVGCHSIPFLFARLAACKAGLDNPKGWDVVATSVA